MRTLICILILAFAVPSMVRDAAGEAIASTQQEVVKHYLVEITTMSKETTFEVMSKDSYQALQKETRKKKMIFPRAVREARKEWKKNPETNKSGFPSSVAAAPKVKMVGIYADSVKAEERKKELEEQLPEEPEDKRILWLEARNTQIRIDMNNPPKNIPKDKRQRWVGNLTLEMQRNEEELGRRIEKRDKRKEIEATAISCIEEQVSKLEEAQNAKE